MQLLEYTISFLWILLEVISFSLFYAAFLTIKKKKETSIAVILVTWMLMCVYSNLGLNSFLKQIISLTVLTVMATVVYDGKFLTKLLLSVICYIFTAVIDTAVPYGVSAFLGLSLSDFSQKMLLCIVVVTTGKLLVIFFAWLLYKLRAYNGLYGIKSQWFLLTILFPAVSVVMCVIIFYSYQDDSDLSIGATMFSFFLAIANVAILYIINAMERATVKEQEMKILKQQIAMQSENITVFEANYRKQRKATHEFERHIGIIQDLLSGNRYEDAAEYVSELRKDRPLQEYHIRSNHSVIDILLNQKNLIALEKGINVQIQVNDLSSVCISPNMLAVLLSNILDNAIEACQQIPENRQLNCSLLLEDSLYISVRNTSLPVKIVNGNIETTKEAKEDHGYGIPAAKYILYQLNAEFTFAYENGWFLFAAEIPN